MNDFIIPMMNEFVLHNCGKVPAFYRANSFGGIR